MYGVAILIRTLLFVKRYTQDHNLLFLWEQDYRIALIIRHVFVEVEDLILFVFSHIPIVVLAGVPERKDPDTGSQCECQAQKEKRGSHNLGFCKNNYMSFFGYFKKITIPL